MSGTRSVHVSCRLKYVFCCIYHSNPIQKTSHRLTVILLLPNLRRGFLGYVCTANERLSIRARYVLGDGGFIYISSSLWPPGWPNWKNFRHILEKCLDNLVVNRQKMMILFPSGLKCLFYTILKTISSFHKILGLFFKPKI